MYVCLDPCTGTPNTNQCADSSILRWTYNSVTDKCEIFNYYDCIPSPNTFSSRKACKNNCKGRRICPTVVCGNNCYVSTKKNDCSKCICPCKVYREIFYLVIIFVTFVHVLLAHVHNNNYYVRAGACSTCNVYIIIIIMYACCAFTCSLF